MWIMYNKNKQYYLLYEVDILSSFIEIYASAIISRVPLLKMQLPEVQ